MDKQRNKWQAICIGYFLFHSRVYFKVVKVSMSTMENRCVCPTHVSTCVQCTYNVKYNVVLYNNGISDLREVSTLRKSWWF